MTLEEMRNAVMGIIEDRSFDPATITSYINTALNTIAGVIDIPEFKRVFTVATATDTAYVALGSAIPSFGGRVRRVKYDGQSILIKSSLEHLLDDFDDLEEVGDIEAVTLEGRNLWYAKIPEESVDLLVLCYVNPEPLSENNRTIAWMPEHCQRKTLVFGAAAELWKLIEEEDSEQPMTRRYERDFQDGIVEFRGWIARNRQSMGYSAWRY